MSSTLRYTDLQRQFDPLFPKHDLRYYWRARQLDDLTDDVVAEIEAAFDRRPFPLSMISIWALGGAMSRVGPQETAVGRRDGRFLVETLANWKAARDTDRNVAWVKEAFAAPRLWAGPAKLQLSGSCRGR